MSPSPAFDRLQAHRDLIRGSAIRWGVLEEAAEIVEKMPVTVLRTKGELVRYVPLDAVLSLLRQQWPDGET